MKKKRRIHHHAANTVRRLFSKQKPHASEADQSAAVIAAEGAHESQPPALQSVITGEGRSNGGEDCVSDDQCRYPNPYEQAQLRLTRWLVGATVAIAIATVLYMAVSLYQAYTSRISARAAEQATQIAKEARRPVVIQDIDLAKLTDKMDFEIRLHNDGGSPVDAILKYCFIPSQSPNINSPTLTDCYQITTKGPIFVTPGSPKTITVRLWNTAWVQAIRQRELYLFIVTAVSYEDFGEHRERVTCSVYREDFAGVGDCSDFVDTRSKNPARDKNP